MLEGEWTGKVRPVAPVDRPRLASLCLAVFWIVAMTLEGALAGRNGLRLPAPPGTVAAFINFLYSLLVLAPLGLIWFPRELGRDLPPTLVRAIGWLGLLLLTVGTVGIALSLAAR